MLAQTIVEHGLLDSLAGSLTSLVTRVEAALGVDPRVLWVVGGLAVLLLVTRVLRK